MNIQRIPILPDRLRRKLMFSLPGGLVFATPMALVGCGGGGDASADGDIQGKVVLPPGVKMADATVVSGAQEVKPEGDGRFSTDLADDALGLLTVVHASEKVLGYAMTRRGVSDQAIDHRSSAAALIFLAAGGVWLEAADAHRVHDAIKAHSQTENVAAVLKARTDVDPYALDGPDDAIVAAVIQAVSALRRSPASAARRPSARRMAANDVQPLLRIEPGGEVNGISVNQDGDTPGFSIVNTKRRAGYAHLYKVGYKMPDAPQVDLAQAEPVGNLLRVPSTLALSIAAIPGAFLGGPVPWEPKTTARVPLAMHEGAESTFYEIVYLTPVWDRAEPDFFITAPRFATHAALWRTELEGLHQTSVLQLVFGAVLAGLGVGANVIEEAAFLLAFEELNAAAAATPNLFALMKAARGGVQMLPTVRSWLTLMAGAEGRIAIVNDVVWPAMAGLVARGNAVLAGQMAARTVARVRMIAFQGAMRALLATWAVLGVVDTGAQWKDLHTGEKGSLFSATLVGPKVQVSPSSGKVGKGEEQTLTARVTGAQGVTLTYRWTLTGSNLANLSDRAGKIGLTIDTDKDVVVLATTSSTVGTLTVTVEAFQVKAGGNRSLGEAVAKLEMDNNIIKLTPEVARIERVGGDQLFTFSMTAPPVADALFYEWRCASQVGRLISGGEETSSARTSIVSAAPTARYLGRDGLDGGESETIICIAFHTPADPNTGQAVRTNIGQAAAEVQVKQKFNLEIVSLPTITPANNTVAVMAQITDPVPAGASIEWSWLHSGVGSIQTSLTDANKPNSSVQFASGAVEELAIFTVSARVVVPGQAAVPVLPVTASTQVKKNLVQVVVNAKGGVYGCTDPKACGVSAYTAFLVPRYSMAVLYQAVLSGYDYPGCNRTVTWTGVLGDGGGCNFPVTYFPHSSAGATDTWAVWIGFGGPLSGKCVVTITLAP